MENKVFKYNGSPVTFQIGGGDTMVNATEMAKPFGKRPIDYLRLPSTNQLINAIVRKYHNCENQLVIKKAGTPESGGGTWMHKDVALDFAHWLSIDFKLWCNDRILELMKYGFTATDATLDNLLSNPDQAITLFTELKKERERSAERLREEREMADHWQKVATETTKDIKYAFDTARFNEMLARRYFFYTDAYLHLLKENGIRIPAKLKITRYNYQTDLRRLKDPGCK